MAKVTGIDMLDSIELRWFSSDEGGMEGGGPEGGVSCFGRGTPCRDHLLVIAVLCKSLSDGTDLLQGDDKELTIPLPNRVGATSSLCSPPCASPAKGNCISKPKFGEKDPDRPPEKLDEPGDTGEVSLGVTSPELPDETPKFPATLRLPPVCLYIPRCSGSNVVGIAATTCLHFLGGGCRDNVNAPWGEKEGVGGVFELGGVLAQLASKTAVDNCGASRSFDIFKSDAVIITGALADRRLGAGEPCPDTCGSGRGSE